MGRDLGDKAGVVVALQVLAAVAAEQEDAAQALRLLAVAASVREEMGLPIHPIDRALLQPHLDNVGVRLGEVEPALSGNVLVADVVELALSSF
jgi:hypothetical protein